MFDLFDHSTLTLSGTLLSLVLVGCGCTYDFDPVVSPDGKSQASAMLDKGCGGAMQSSSVVLSLDSAHRDFAYFRPAPPLRMRWLSNDELLVEVRKTDSFKGFEKAAKQVGEVRIRYSLVEPDKW